MMTLQSIVGADETLLLVDQEQRDWHPANDQMDGRELNGETMDGKTLTAFKKTPVTDELIVDLVRRALHASPYGQLPHLQAYCDNGRVTLQGRLPTYYLKQVAQVLIDAVPGVRDVDNDVSVFSPR